MPRHTTPKGLILTSPEVPAARKFRRRKPRPTGLARWSRRVFCGLLLALAIPAVTTAGPGGRSGPPPTVTVAPIGERDVVPANEYVGHVEAIQAVDLRARVEGFLEKINFKEGDFVRAGTLLYVIEQAPYQARVAAARARIDQAEAELVRAGQHLKRLQSALKASISATDMDNAVAHELSARASLAAARADLKISELDLGYTTIRAPISGRIGRTALTCGNLVEPGSGPLARIVQVDPIRVVYSISENDLPALQAALHDAAQTTKRLLAPQLRLAGGKVLKATGRLSFVDNHVDPDTGTIAVWARFKNPDGLLIPGQYVTVLVKARASRVMPVVPQAAVLVNRKGRFVLMVDDKSRVVARPIVIGPVVGTYWAVKSGLKAGETIIVQGIQKARPGQPVRVRRLKPQGDKP
jgi:membrane fusion protein (multidrug efflux system)